MEICIITGGFYHPYNQYETNNAILQLALEMQKQGNMVSVILTIPSFLTFLDKNNLKYILSKKKSEYSIHGINVLFCPQQKLVPYTLLISPLSSWRTKRNIKYFVEKYNLNPDLVLVHYASLQYSVANFLQKKYGWKPVFVFHNCDLVFPKVVKKVIDSSIKVGVRSKQIQEKITSIVGHDIQSFQVFSGYPDSLLESYNPRSYKSGNNRETHHLLYAGKFQSLKNVDVIIRALAQIKDEYHFTFDIIGDGEMKLELINLVDSLNLKDRVIFHGNKPREYVLNMMQNSDCFIMVSSPETLGLVYMEALGCGCFVIGSKGEGIDGIIRDKENGMLVTPRSVGELVTALEYYFNMDNAEFERIMKAAHETALQYTESSVAKRYIQDALEAVNR